VVAKTPRWSQPKRFCAWRRRRISVSMQRIGRLAAVRDAMRLDRVVLGMAGRNVSHGTFAGSDATAGTAKYKRRDDDAEREGTPAHARIMPG
jgi:hypothetical protein